MVQPFVVVTGPEGMSEVLGNTDCGAAQPAKTTSAMSAGRRDLTEIAWNRSPLRS